MECLHASEDLLRKAENAAKVDRDIEQAISRLQTADDELRNAQTQLADARSECSAVPERWQAW